MIRTIGFGSTLPNILGPSYVGAGAAAALDLPTSTPIIYSPPVLPIVNVPNSIQQSQQIGNPTYPTQTASGSVLNYYMAKLLPLAKSIYNSNILTFGQWYHLLSQVIGGPMATTGSLPPMSQIMTVQTFLSAMASRGFS
jgi:hypothetical protein